MPKTLPTRTKLPSENDLLRDMSLFVEVGKQRSFSRAAASLQVSLSLVSRRIAGLERSLGLQLLKRTTRKLELTEAGAFLLQRCQHLVDEAKVVHGDVREMRSAARGLLRVSMPVDFGVTMVGPLLMEFSQLYPEISVDCDVSPQKVDLVSGHFDLAIRLGAQPDSALVQHPLVKLESHVYASPAYLKREGTPQHPSELAGHECVRILGPRADSTWSLHKGAEKIEVGVKGRLALNNMGMINRLVASGMGVGIIADPIARANVQTGQLVQLLGRWSAAPFPVMAVTVTRLLPAKTRAFLDFLVERLARSA